jgi:DNA-binding NtrC family response regulator
MKDRILVVDDDQDQCDLLQSALLRLDCHVTTTTSPRDALDHVGRETFDVILTDIGMSDMDGLELCTRIIGTRPDVPVIVITAHGSMESAISAMRAGAYDFLTKPVDNKLLGMCIARAAQHHRLQAEVKQLREASVRQDGSRTLIGDSPAMKSVQDLIARVGGNDVSVLIEGETGTGKELVARGLHAASPRRAGPFVAINCAAVPSNLLESELFGHARGAFTDAKAQREGLFVQASGGTLFLDEIGEMPLDMQTKLLRALQERTVRPVGSNTELSFDARIVAATHRDLESDVDEKRFREDLFYRINVVKIQVPPLRERSSDILTLAAHFLKKFADRRAGGAMTLPPQVAALLLAYQWPGNVRELENCLERAVALARLDHISAEDIPEKIRSYRPDRFVVSADDPAEIITLEALDRSYIIRAVKLLGGNKSRAAQLLGVDRRTLYRRLEKYEGVQPELQSEGGERSSESPATAQS